MPRDEWAEARARDKARRSKRADYGEALATIQPPRELAEVTWTTIMPGGEYAGKSLEQLSEGYLNWLLTFDAHTGRGVKIQRFLRGNL